MRILLESPVEGARVVRQLGQLVTNNYYITFGKRASKIRQMLFEDRDLRPWNAWPN